MKDVFGKALYSYWKGDHKSLHTIERDDGYTDTGTLAPYFSTKPTTLENEVLRYISGKQILDVGCANGRTTLYLQRKGYAVTGIDTSFAAIQTAKERGCKAVRRLDIFNSGLLANSFDCIILFGNNLGIGGTLSGTTKLLKKLKRLLTPSGFILITAVDVTVTKKPQHLAYQKQSRLSGRTIGEMKLRIHYKDQTSDWFRWIQISPKLLQQLAHRTNLKVQKIFKGRHGQYSAVLKKA